MNYLVRAMSEPDKDDLVKTIVDFAVEHHCTINNLRECFDLVEECMRYNAILDESHQDIKPIQ